MYVLRFWIIYIKNNWKVPGVTVDGRPVPSEHHRASKVIVSPASKPTSNEFPDITPTQSSLKLDYESDIPLKDSPKVSEMCMK